jgi:hypothetical protein
MATKITTDHKWRQFKYRYEVPAAVLADRFNYLSEDDAPDGFFNYRGWWYHTSDFEYRAPDTIGGFDGIHCDSFYSGVVLKISANGETYRAGTLIITSDA